MSLNNERPLEILDISPLLSERTGVFPGDTKFSRSRLLEIDRGHNIDLSSITSTLHLGAHADAPSHYEASGQAIHERSLNRYLGRCLVLHANAPRGSRVEKKHFGDQAVARGFQGSQKILVRTESFPDPDAWNSDFCSFSPELIEEWAKAGITTIGIDTPSIDPEDSKDLPSHKMVAKYDLSVLEGLVLKDVDEGYYTLIALPLKIENADAAPLRAVLVKDLGSLLG